MASPIHLDLWHDYLRQLKAFFPGFSSEDGNRIYAAPLTSVGISIGQSISQQIVNHDLFHIGDLLLPVNSPVFLPGPSYSQRLLRYLQAVEVPPGRQDHSSTLALRDANSSLADETDQFLTCRRKAFKAYQEDPEFGNVTFDAWIVDYYPPYQLSQYRKNAASQLAYQACVTYYGPQTSQIWQDKAMVSRAFSEKPNPPYNMPTSVAQVTQQEVVDGGKPPPVNPEDLKQEPRYNIDATFTNLVTYWIKNYDNAHNKPFKITFRASSNSSPSKASKTFNDVGFTKVQLDQDNIVPILPVFTAKFPDQPTDSRQPSLEAGVGNHDSSITVTIEATAAQVFEITPDSSWNIPDVAAKYNLRSDASSDLYEPLVLVRYVLLGYMVSITIQTDKQLFSEITSGLDRVKSLGGTATLFGLDVGADSSDSVLGFDQIRRSQETQTISIPARNNAQLTMLGLVGQKLKTPRKT